MFSDHSRAYFRRSMVVHEYLNLKHLPSSLFVRIHSFAIKSSSLFEYCFEAKNLADQFISRARYKNVGIK